MATTEWPLQMAPKTEQQEEPDRFRHFSPTVVDHFCTDSRVSALSSPGFAIQGGFQKGSFVLPCSATLAEESCDFLGPNNWNEGIFSKTALYKPALLFPLDSFWSVCSSRFWASFFASFRTSSAHGNLAAASWFPQSNASCTAMYPSQLRKPQPQNWLEDAAFYERGGGLTATIARRVRMSQPQSHMHVCTMSLTGSATQQGISETYSLQARMVSSFHSGSDWDVYLLL